MLCFGVDWGVKHSAERAAIAEGVAWKNYQARWPDEHSLSHSGVSCNARRACKSQGQHMHGGSTSKGSIPPTLTTHAYPSIVIGRAKGSRGRAGKEEARGPAGPTKTPGGGTGSSAATATNDSARHNVRCMICSRDSHRYQIIAQAVTLDLSYFLRWI